MNGLHIYYSLAVYWNNKVLNKCLQNKVTWRFGKEVVIGKEMIREREVFMYGNGLDKASQGNITNNVATRIIKVWRGRVPKSPYIGLDYKAFWHDIDAPNNPISH